MNSDRPLIWLKPQFIGDAVMALPMIDIVCSHHRPLIVAGNVVRAVLADRSEKLDFAPGFKVKGLSGLREAVSWLRAQDLQRVYLVNRSFRSALAARIAGIPERIGHSTEGRGVLLTHSVRYDVDRYEAECYVDLLETKSESVVPKLSLVAGESPIERPGTFGIQPGARYASKRLDFSTMAEIAAALAHQGFEIGIAGGSDEAHQMAEFAGLLSTHKGVTAEVISRPDLRETMRAIAGLAGLIGSDTGLMHISAALGTPTVVAFGPNSPKKWGHPMAWYRAMESPLGIRSITAQMILSGVTEVKRNEGRTGLPILPSN